MSKLNFKSHSAVGKIKDIVDDANTIAAILGKSAKKRKNVKIPRPQVSIASSKVASPDLLVAGCRDFS